MSKIKKITVSNLKAVSALSIDFNGCTGIITGGNNKGKSSFLKSLPERLRGNKPDLVLKHGEKEGFSELELTTGEKFIWNFDGKKEKLTFISERNIKSSVTKELTSYYFPATFDVDAFLNSTPAKQKSVLQKLTGIDFTEIDLKYKEAYENRTYENKRASEEKVLFDAVSIDDDLPIEITPTDNIKSQISGIDSHNLKYSTRFDLLQAKQKLITDNQKEIDELKAKIKTIEQKNSVINGEIFEIDAWLDEPENKQKSKEEIELIKRSLELVEDKNKMIEQNNKAIKQQASYNKSVEDAASANDEVKYIEQEKADVIKNASMPDGFGFNDDGITYNGFAFDKDTLSSSGIYIAALKLAAIGLGEVKTLYFDASYLDKNSLADIEKWANENDLQLLIERPDFEGGEIEYQIANI